MLGTQPDGRAKARPKTRQFELGNFHHQIRTGTLLLVLQSFFYARFPV